MARLSNTEWLNSNSTRAYPFREGSSLSNGTTELPRDFLVDAIFSGTDETLRYRMNYVEVLSGGVVQLGFSDSAGTFIGVVNISTPIPARYMPQFLQPVDGVPVRGKVVFGLGVNEVGQLPVGRKMYGFSSTELEPSILVPAPNVTPKVTSLGVLGDELNTLTGDVKIEGGEGVVATSFHTSNIIRLDLSKQYKLDCPEDLGKYERCANCIKYINGIAPRSDGNFDIVGTEFISVENDSANNRILVRFLGDVDCCCTACDELSGLQAQVDQVTANNNALGASIGNSPDANLSSVVASPLGFPSGGSTTITVVVVNSVGDPMPNQTVSLSTFPAVGAGFTPGSGTTNSNGIFSSSMTSGVPQLYTVVATVNPGGSQTILSQQPVVTVV
jgi:hypothetical protein